ncbi:MAG: hydrogenase maturation nickel metallochaperone HypA [Caldilineaceae bacterium]
MHELAIAQRLLETAQRALPPTDAQVAAVQIRLGALAGVSKEELEFGFGVVASGTPFAGARLDIEEIPVIVYCPQCQTEQTLVEPEPLCCPVCGMPTPQVIQGKEIRLKALELKDEMVVG